MIIPFSQNSFSGCGSYCLANLFNDKRYIEDIEKLQEGESLPELNKKLALFYPELYLDYLFVTNSKLKIHPDRLIETLPFEPLWEKVSDDQMERAATPFLITVKLTKRSHSVLIIHNLKDNLYYIFDSLTKERVALQVSSLLLHYHILTVQQLFFWNLPEDKNGLLIYKEGFPHLFNPGE